MAADRLVITSCAGLLLLHFIACILMAR